MPTKHLFANEAFFHLLLFAYNLTQWFKRLCLPEEWQALTLAGARSRLLLIPGEVIRARNQPILRLPTTYPYQDVWRHALKKIDRLKP